MRIITNPSTLAPANTFATAEPPSSATAAGVRLRSYSTSARYAGASAQSCSFEEADG